MKATYVFTPNKSPDVTYVGDQLEVKKTTLFDSLETGGSVISLSGPSKSGKTVFVEKVLGKHRLVPVTGAGVDSTGRFWERVFDKLGVAIKKSRSTASGTKTSAKGGISGGLEKVLKVEIGGGKEFSKQESESADYTTDYLQLAISKLGDTNLVIFIDDFHYIPSSVQSELCKELKVAAQKNVNFICASVPYHSDDTIIANPDLRGRVTLLDFDYWCEDELKKIAYRGFNALNIDVQVSLIDAMASEAAGSPQLMQALCLNACFESSIREMAKTRQKIVSNLEFIKNICIRTAATTDYSSIVEQIEDGPKLEDKNTTNYIVLNDNIENIYTLILRAIAYQPPELTIRFRNMQSRIEKVCNKNPPGITQISKACIQLTSIANDLSNASVAEWDEEADVLDIRDPYFLFYLRWGRFQT